MKNYNRRDLFKQFGASALLLYPILSSRNARAADAAKKRLLVMTTSSGIIQSSFWPTGTPASYSFTGTSLAPLAALMPSLTVAKGLMNDWGNGDSHSAGMVSLVTGNNLDASSSTNGRTDFLPGNKFAYNASIDQLVAMSPGFKGLTPISSMSLAIQPTADRPSKYASFNANGTYIQPSTNPYTVFAAIFKPLVANCSAGGQTPAQTVAALQARRKSIFDTILLDLADASRQAGLDASEKAKLDAYTASINQIEKTMGTAAAAGGSTACTTLAPFISDPVIQVNDQNYNKIGRLMLDLIIAAFQLDVSRVATLVWDVGGNNGVPNNFLDYNGVPIVEGYHDLSHGGIANYEQKMGVITAYHATEFAYFLSQLKASTEGTGSMLDNSLAMWMSELGNGSNHDGYSIPFVVGGSAGGAFKTGRYLQFNGNPKHQGALLAVLQAMGVSTTSVGNSGNISPLL